MESEELHTDEEGFQYHATGGYAYTTRWYADCERAHEFAEQVRKEGRRAKGGFFHCMKLGTVTTHEREDGTVYSVTC